jgi:transcriptional regulator with XRE-family HTH domain
MQGASCLQGYRSVTTGGMLANEDLHPGAIASLLRRYAALRGFSQRRLARVVDTDIQRIAHLMRGFDYKGVRALGIISRADHEPLLVSVARALEIPTSELAFAIAEDIGLPAPLPSGAPDEGPGSSVGRARV